MFLVRPWGGLCEPMSEMTAPDYPAGPFEPGSTFDPSRRRGLIAEIRGTPAALRKVVFGLSDDQLDTRYRNWTIRQIVHHLADSHVNSYIRFKWTLTEEQPTIKAYNEGCGQTWRTRARAISALRFSCWRDCTLDGFNYWTCYRMNSSHVHSSTPKLARL